MPLSKCRAPYDIIADILKASQEGISQNELIRKARLEKRRMKVYVEQCRVNGLLTGEWFLYLTEKGRNYLRIYEKLVKTLEDSNRMWRKRKEWLVKQAAEGKIGDRATWQRTLEHTEAVLRKSKTDKILEILMFLSEQAEKAITV